MQNVARSPATGNPLEDTGRIPALFSQSGPSPAPAPVRPLTSDPTAEPDYPAIQRSPEFGALRRSRRRFVFPMTALFFAWYLTFVLLAAYAPEFMGTPVAGSINVGILLGLGQFGSTVLITWAYVRYARRSLDPKVAAIRKRAGVAP